jgi:hypothetical protein
MSRIAAAIVAVAAFPMVAAGACPAARTQTAHCNVRATRAALCRFVAALNNGAASQLLAPKGQFRRYTVGGPGSVDTRKRRAVAVYLGERQRQSEQLALTWFSFSRSARGAPWFRFDVVRRAEDLTPPTLYRGAAKFICGKRCRLASLTMAPNTEPSVPAPQTYAETCRLAPTWCEIQPTPGGIPDELRRPLRFPTVNPGDDCPVTTTTQSIPSGHFHILGDGPVGPDIFAFGQSLGPGLIRFIAVGDRGWYAAKTLWLAPFSAYRGPVLIRGRQLDGSHNVVMTGGGAFLVEPQLGPGDTLNGYPDGLREWPGGTYLRTPGCYAWQVDGTNFSTLIVFEAVFR